MDMDDDTYVARLQFLAVIARNISGKHNLFVFLKHRFASHAPAEAP